VNFINSKKIIYGLLYFTIFSLPFLIFAQFYCDDKILIFTKDSINYLNLSRINFMYESFYGMLLSGRLYLLYLFHYLIFYTTNDRLIYHIIKFLFNLLSIFLVIKYIYNITKNHNNYIVYFFIIISLFQITIAVDPILSMGISVQLSAIFIFLTLIFLDLYLKKHRQKYFLLSHIFCFLSYSYYEMGICIIPLIIILNNRHRINKYNVQGGFINYFQTTLKSCFHDLKSYLIIFVSWVSLYIFVKIYFENGYDGVAFGSSLENFFATWIIQIIASFPLGSLNQKLISYKIEFWQIITSFLLFWMAYFPLKKNLPKINLENYYRDIILIGLTLILVPSMIVSFSEKYQSWSWNNFNEYNYAFLQVFLQYFGVAFLLICFIAKTIKNSQLYSSKLKQKILINFYAVLISSLISIVALLNYNAILEKNIKESSNNLILISRAIESGLFENNISSEKITKFNKIISIKGFSEIFDKSLNKFSSKDDFKNEYKILINNPFYLTNFSFFKDAKQVMIPFYIDKVLNSKMIFDEDKVFFIDYNSPNYEVDINEYDLTKNFDGFVIFGKLISVEFKNTDSVYKFVSKIYKPKIYIDKKFLSKLPKIAEILNKKFDEIVIKANEIDALRNKILNTKNGIIIDLPAKNYQVIF
jgi:hypothetical protein